MIHLPTVKQLQYLTALYEHRHFGKAADACFVTQSTLSAGLRELELALDVVLVERTKRVVRFTPLGERIARKGYRVLQEVTELAQMAQAAGTPLADELRMGVIPTIAPFFLPRALPRLRQDYPRLRLYLREEMSGAVMDGLMRGQIDCGLIAALSDGRLRNVAAVRRPFSLAHSMKAIFPARPTAPPTQIDELICCCWKTGTPKDQALAACDRPELRADRAILGTSLHTLSRWWTMAWASPGAADGAGRRHPAGHGGRAARPLAAEKAKRTIALIWRKSSPREVEFRLLAQALQAAQAAPAG